MSSFIRIIKTLLLDSLGLLHEQNMGKMRLLTFMEMAVENKFLLIRCNKNFRLELLMLKCLLCSETKKVYCKIDQTQRKVVFSHSAHWTFGKQQWQNLYDTRNAWKQNLKKVKNKFLSLIPEFLCYQFCSFWEKYLIVKHYKLK